MDTYTRTWSQSWLKSDNTVDTQSEAISGSNTEQTGETLTVKLTDEQKKAADTNADGKVDITDATMIQKYVAELIDHLGKK